MTESVMQDLYDTLTPDAIRAMWHRAQMDLRQIEPYDRVSAVKMWVDSVTYQNPLGVRYGRTARHLRVVDR